MSYPKEPTKTSCAISGGNAPTTSNPGISLKLHLVLIPMAVASFGSNSESSNACICASCLSCVRRVSLSSAKEDRSAPSEHRSSDMDMHRRKDCWKPASSCTPKIVAAHRFHSTLHHHFAIQRGQLLSFRQTLMSAISGCRTPDIPAVSTTEDLKSISR